MTKYLQESPVKVIKSNTRLDNEILDSLPSLINKKGIVTRGELRTIKYKFEKIHFQNYNK